MRWSKVRVLAGAIAALSIAGQAAAAVVVTTYRGTIANGFDTTGVFGAAGASLANLAFVAVFETNSDAPGAIDSQFSQQSFISGGAPTPPVTGKLTINGITEVFNGDFGQQSQSDNGSSESFTHFASNHLSNSNFGSLMAGGSGSGLDFLPGADWRTFAGADLDLVTNLFGSVDIFQADPDTNMVIRKATANFNVTSVSVPEPQAWTLMILGFMAVGAAIRLRRQPGSAQRPSRS